jgi:hypothetical protein
MAAHRATREPLFHVQTSFSGLTPSISARIYCALNQRTDARPSTPVTSITISYGSVGGNSRAVSNPAATGMSTNRSLTNFMSEAASLRFSASGSVRPWTTSGSIEPAALVVTALPVLAIVTGARNNTNRVTAMMTTVMTIANIITPGEGASDSGADTGCPSAGSKNSLTCSLPRAAGK